VIGKSFYISFVLVITPEDNILSSDENAHRYDVADLINNVMYDIDDIKIDSLKVKERF
tara:strand:- start:818 stop:991 length:174 start_codon:yes stop_codon:yes gene_type:complete